MINGQCVRAAAIDLEGVMYRGNKLLPGAAEFCLMLKRLAIPYCFLTNISAGTPAEIAKHLHTLGLRTGADAIVTSSQLLVNLVLELPRDWDAVAVVGGGNALRQELLDANILAAPLGDARVRTARKLCLAFGWTEDFDNTCAAELLNVRERIVLFVATDEDVSFPAANKIRPGLGWVVAAAERLVGKDALIAGKPNPKALGFVARRLGVPVRELLMIGDSAISDVSMGRAAGSLTALVTIGVSSATDIGPSALTPDLTVANLIELSGLLESLA